MWTRASSASAGRAQLSAARMIANLTLTPRENGRLRPRLSSAARIRDEEREHGVIEPAAVATLGLSRDALEAESKPPDHTERGMVVRRGGDADAMRVDRTEGPVENGP